MVGRNGGEEWWGGRVGMGERKGRKMRNGGEEWWGGGGGMVGRNGGRNGAEEGEEWWGGRGGMVGRKGRKSAVNKNLLLDLCVKKIFFLYGKKMLFSDWCKSHGSTEP
jgi:hypothetical protein